MKEDGTVLHCTLSHSKIMWFLIDGAEASLPTSNARVKIRLRSVFAFVQSFVSYYTPRH